ncbi:MAG: polymer-forming cytoskeletal protein [Candidatus Sumerlaeota bacterium]|nr:polymer-forming cytoskeletal protein [Candidatus Sumerlaeota bacterium]
MEQPVKKANMETILGEDAIFTGKIESRGQLRIDGRVDGEIVAQDTLVIGPSGVVKANIKAAIVSVSGQISGAIEASRKVELHPTAVVIGDISTAVGALTIEAGAKIDGRCTMTSDKAPKPPEAPKPAVAPAPATLPMK